MSKAVKVWLIVAGSITLLGCIILAGVMLFVNGDIIKMFTNRYETNKYDISEEFSSISLNTDTAEITFVLYEASNASVECFEPQSLKHSVNVKDGILFVEVSTKKWYDYIGISVTCPKITVYLPKAEYSSLTVNGSTGDIEISNSFKFENINIAVSTARVKSYASASQSVKIAASTGDIYVEDTTAESLEIVVSTGKVTVSDVTCEGDISIGVTTGKTLLNNINCKNFKSNGSTGDISLNNVIANEKLSIERSTGRVIFDGSDADEIFVKTDTGDVKGSLLSDKVFLVRTDTGDIDVPKTVAGGKCEITTDTGDIKITVK